MTIYTKPPHKTLKVGDTIKFPVKGERFVYTVQPSYLMRGDGNNNSIFAARKIADKHAFCSRAYGYKTATGLFPECRHGDMAALTRVARLLFAGITKKQVAMWAKQDREEAAAKARTLAALPTRAHAVAKALNADRSAFGCQRGAVIKLVSALLGCDLGKVVES